MLAGPTSSGKTTTAERLVEKFAALEKTAKVVSLDDFYFDRNAIPIEPDGTQDLEAITTLDLEYLYRCLKDLLTVGYAQFPVFDFPTAKRKTKTRRISYDSEHILIIEGIHALNPLIINGIASDKFYRVYISVSSEYWDHDMVILSRYELRLIRRMVRDVKNRNIPADETLSMWKTVRGGEKMYIAPFEESADYFVDSILAYEPGMFKNAADSVLRTIPKSSKNWEWAQMLLEALALFEHIPLSHLPKQSLLNEFLS